jgi:hypothetical protein
MGTFRDVSCSLRYNRLLSARQPGRGDPVSGWGEGRLESRRQGRVVCFNRPDLHPPEDTLPVDQEGGRRADDPDPPQTSSPMSCQRVYVTPNESAKGWSFSR